jgi:hypothetical protein
MCLPLDTKHPYCKIVLAGPLVEHWADYLGDMLLEVEVRDGEVQTSTLTAQPADLLAFIGMLSALANWDLTVVALEYRRTEGVPDVTCP